MSELAKPFSRIEVEASASGVKSNQILLVVKPPPEVIDDPGVDGYLRPDVAASGRLEVNRLGGAAILPRNVNRPRY